MLTIDAVHYAGDAHEANEFTAGPTSIPTSARGGVLVDGDCRFCTNDSYRCLRLDAYQFKQAEVAEYLGYFEQVDGRLYPFGWRDPAYDDSGWDHADWPMCGSRIRGLSPSRMSGRNSLPA